MATIERFENILAWQKAKQLAILVYAAVGEVRSMTHVGKELNIISYENAKNIHDLSLEISKMLSGFIKKL